MIQFKNFNKISPKLEQAQRKLKPGETATFQMLTGIRNIDFDPQVMKDRPVLYGKVQIPTRQVIKDPETQKPIDIALIEIGENDQIVFKPFIAGLRNNAPIPNYHANGRFTLNGDSLEDQEVLDVISLVNENKRNPFRDPTKEATFYEIIETEISTDNNNRRAKLREALNKIDAMDIEEVRDIAAALGFNYTNDDVIVRDNVSTYAENEPVTFLSLLQDDLTPIKSDVTRALRSGIISYEPGEGKVKMGAIILITLAGFGRESFDYVLRLSEWLKSTPDGQKQYKVIKNQLKNKQESKPA